MPEFITVTRASAFFTTHRAYGVIRWHNGAPQVRNDHGSLTWLVERAWWAPAPRPQRVVRPARARGLHLAWVRHG